MHKFKLIYNNVYIKFNQCVHTMKQSNKHNYFIIFSSFHTFLITLTTKQHKLSIHIIMNLLKK